jgi:hypothetical protein
MSKNCKRKLCLRQPPTLKGIVSSCDVNFFYDIRNVNLNCNATYSLYIFSASRKSLIYWRFVRTPYRRFVRTPYRRFVRTPYRRFVRTPYRRFVRTPYRRFVKTPYRRGVKTPYGRLVPY